MAKEKKAMPKKEMPKKDGKDMKKKTKKDCM